MDTASWLIVLLLFAANLMLASIMWALGEINWTLKHILTQTKDKS